MALPVALGEVVDAMIWTCPDSQLIRWLRASYTPAVPQGVIGQGSLKTSS
jgi:hypothetical protein